jgi:phosphoglycerate dehydrogenase-like enzyme
MFDIREQFLGTENIKKTKKIKALITMITPSLIIKEALADLEPYADIKFLEEGESVADYLEDIEVFYGTLEEKDFSKARNLKWLQTNSTGVDHVMYPAFQNSDIILTNTGRSITTIVAEHSLTMLFALARNLHLQRDMMKKHQWEIVWGREIGSMTLGILGFGKIGSAIAERAKPFIRKIHVLDIRPLVDNENIDKVYSLENLDKFLASCDGVICSLPLTVQTHNLISTEEFKVMRNDAYLINISRGEIVDEKALLNALRNGEIAGAGIDVLEKEPCPPDSPLWDEPNLLLTPHSAGYCEFLELRKIKQFVSNFKQYIKNKKIPGCINKNNGW